MLFGSISIPEAPEKLVLLNDSVESVAMQGPPTDYGAAAVKMFLSLILLIALLCISLWFIRRLIQQRVQRGNEAQAIQILEKRVLSPKTLLYLIEVDGKKIVIAESHLEVKRIESWDLPSEH